MSSDPPARSGLWRLVDLYHQALQSLVRLLGFIAGAGLVVMMLITTADVVLRRLGLSLQGAYDIVCVAAALTIAAALPYTSAIKGHVAIEYLFQKLGRRGRIVGDSLMRLVVLVLFSLLAWQSVRYGDSLKASGTTSMTIRLPIFWVPYVLAVSCGLVVLIKVYHLFHPGKSLLKP